MYYHYGYKDHSRPPAGASIYIWMLCYCLYLKWNSHHPISSKYSVVGTLHHRTKTICSGPYMLQNEEHLSSILTRCKYPTWAINRVQMKMRTPAQKKKNNNSTNTQQNCQKPYMVVPYYQGLSESVKRTCNKHGVQVHFRGRCHHQEPPDGPQGPGSYAEEKWGHL